VVKEVQMQIAGAAVDGVEIGPVPAVIPGLEIIAVRVGDVSPPGAVIVAVAERPSDPAHVGAGRGEPANPVVDVGNPLARGAVEPGRCQRVALLKRVRSGNEGGGSLFG